VTLLFADVEGSTRLLYALGERFAPARARLREVVRDAAASQGGHEVDWAGDGVFLAFERASDAVAAATDIQRSLSTEPWGHDAPLAMRIGIHTGEPELGPEGYVGLDVHIAARICSAAHGGQVVVSPHEVTPVSKAGKFSVPFYRVESADFTAPADGAFELVLETVQQSGTTTVFIDDVRVVEVAGGL
jgi:class 3 adenylate cyclase